MKYTSFYEIFYMSSDKLKAPTSILIFARIAFNTLSYSWLLCILFFFFNCSKLLEGGIHVLSSFLTTLDLGRQS